MQKMAIISIDGHAKASPIGYRQYFEQRFLPTYDEWLAGAAERDQRAPGLVKSGLEADCPWDSEVRLMNLEKEGIVAEVLFPNGMPFATRRGSAHDERPSDPGIDRQERMVYNRWLADFCAEAPGRRSGQAQISFDDIDLAVEDVHWAKAHGLGGISMPALMPGGTAYFNPVLDPVWAAIQEVGYRSASMEVRAHPSTIRQVSPRS